MGVVLREGVGVSAPQAPPLKALQVLRVLRVRGFWPWGSGALPFPWAPPGLGYLARLLTWRLRSQTIA